MKYLVIADTYQFAYGCEYTLFGVFDTYEEALNWILENPTVCTYASDSDEEEDYSEYFNFFTNYNEELGGMIRSGRRSQWDNPVIPMTKEEYVARCRYIHQFNGEPMYIGGYQE